MILLCYDGSEDAHTAIEQAGKLLGGQPATVLTVWEPFIEVLARSSFGAGMNAGMVNFEEIDVANGHTAQTRAEEGAELARQAGLDAQARTRTQVTTTAAAILAQASEFDATAIVVGSRGLTGVKSLLLRERLPRINLARRSHRDRRALSGRCDYAGNPRLNGAEDRTIRQREQRNEAGPDSGGPPPATSTNREPRPAWSVEAAHPLTECSDIE